MSADGLKAVSMERWLLGAVVVAAEHGDRTPIEVALAAGVGAETLWREAHRVIWRAMVRLDGAGSPVDVVALAEALGASGELAAAGGFAGLAALSQDVSSPLMAGAHAARLVDLARARRGKAMLAEAASSLAASDDPLAELRDVACGLGELAARPMGEAQVSARDSARDYFLEVEAAAAGSPDPHPRVATGIIALDELLEGGLKCGEMTVVLAPPGGGKSALCQHLALQACAGGLWADVISTEMDTATLVSRAIATLGRFSDGRLKRSVRCSLNPGEPPVDWSAVHRGIAAWSALDRMVTIDAGASPQGISAAAIEARMRSGASRGPGLLVVDYLQDLAPSRPAARGEIRSDLILEDVERLRKAAAATNVCLVVATQPSIQVARERRPSEIGDIADCPRAARGAHVALAVHRPARWDDEADGREAWVSVIKARSGREGKALALWTGYCTRLDDPGSWKPPEKAKVVAIRGRVR